MSKSPLVTLLVAKFISVVLFVLVGLSSSRCSSEHPLEANSTSSEETLKNDSIAAELTDEYAIDMIMRDNPELTYDEAEELLFNNEESK